MGPVETRPEFDCRVKLGQLARVVDYEALLPSSLLSLHPHVSLSTPIVLRYVTLWRT